MTTIAWTMAALATAVVGASGERAHAPPPALRPPWVACSDTDHVAYRTIPAPLNLHAAFSGPVRVRLAAGRTCADLARP